MRIGMPPSDLSGRSGRCGTQSGQVLVDIRIARRQQALQGIVRRRDAGIGKLPGILQRDIHARNRIEARRRALFRIHVPPMVVPRDVRVSEGLLPSRQRFARLRGASPPSRHSVHDCLPR